MGKKVVDDSDRSLEGWANIILGRPSVPRNINTSDSQVESTVEQDYKLSSRKLKKLPLVLSILDMVKNGSSNNCIMATLTNAGYTSVEIFGALRVQDEHLTPDTAEVLTLNGSISKYTWFDARLDFIRKELA